MNFGLNFSDPTVRIEILVKLFIIVLILPLHEYAHAWTAHKLGDDTAMYQGRLTLNPIAHIDPIGAICLLIGGFGWAKPVPVDPTRFSRKITMRKGMALTALAGPLSNFLAAFVGMIVFRIYTCTDYYETYLQEMQAGEGVNNAPLLIYHMLSAFISINVGLCIFNLVPIPPLDGSKILAGLTGAKLDSWYAKNQQIIRIVFLVVLVTGILSVPLYLVETAVIRLLELATDWIPHLFG